MATASMQKSTVQRRVVTLVALDGQGGPAAGAELRFSSVSDDFGNVILGNSPARIELENVETTLQVEATFWGEVLAAILPPGLNRHIFHFRTVSKQLHIGPGTAQCPDGTQGQPCVDCIVNGSVIRICA